MTLTRQKSAPQIPAESLLWTIDTLTKTIGLGRTKIYMLMGSGDFPKPKKIGKSARWLATEIHAWVNAQSGADSPESAG
jgi:predicted DNA-binding transcriptional regulator AlpA